MAKTVLGIFDDVDEAHAAVEELIGLGFDRGDISLIRTRREKQRDADPGEPKTSVKPDWGMAAAGAADTAGSAMLIDSEGGMTDGSMTEGESAAAGAGAGAVIGAGAGLITSMMGLFIPGLGPALGIGPVAATILGGAGLGAIAGGLSGALMNAGVPEDEAAQYTEGVRRGGTLVTVIAPTEQRASDAADVLSGHGAYDIEERATRWRQDTSVDSTTTAVRQVGDDDALADLRGDDWSKVEPEARSRWERAHPGEAWESAKDNARQTWERARTAERR